MKLSSEVNFSEMGFCDLIYWVVLLIFLQNLCVTGARSVHLFARILSNILLVVCVYFVWFEGILLATTVLFPVVCTFSIVMLVLTMSKFSFAFKCNSCFLNLILIFAEC